MPQSDDNSNNPKNEGGVQTVTSTEEFFEVEKSILVARYKRGEITFEHLVEEVMRMNTSLDKKAILINLVYSSEIVKIRKVVSDVVIDVLGDRFQSVLFGKMNQELGKTENNIKGVLEKNNEVAHKEREDMSKNLGKYESKIEGLEKLLDGKANTIIALLTGAFIAIITSLILS